MTMAGYHGHGDAASWPSIPEFYSHKDVLITGGTGFMGKCLLEKLLRSVPNIGKLYVLVRPKKGKEVEERRTALLESKVFDKLRSSNPDALQKIVTLAGDIGLPYLDLSEDDQRLMIETVSVVFHLAATVRFDAPLRQSLQLNLVGTMEMLKLCKQFKKLSTYVHVSTAYAQCNRKNEVIEEKAYPPKEPPEKVVQLLDWMNDRCLDNLTPSFLEGRPNTYTYTKAHAEYFLAEKAKGLPVAIFRPSIIGGAYREPYPGWVDSLHGPGALVSAAGKGMFHSLKCNEHGGTNRADIVPVDLVNNMLIAVGWVTGVNPPKQPAIYNCTSGATNPVTWLEVCINVSRAYIATPFDHVLGLPRLRPSHPRWMWPLQDILLHFAPCFLMDLLLKLQGKKPMMVRAYRKMNEVTNQLEYFTMGEWTWSTEGYNKLLAVMKAKDKETFDFNIRKIDWVKWHNAFCLGLKLYVFKEDLANLPKARRRLQTTRMMIRGLVVLILTTLFYKNRRSAQQLWSSAIKYSVLWINKIGPAMLKMH